MNKIKSSVSNPYVKITVSFIITFVVMYGFYTLIFKMLNSKNDSPWILKGTKNAKNSQVISQDPKNENSITLYRSDNQEGGAQFTYSFWFVIENMQYKFGEWKHMFHKGNKTSNPNRAPGVFLHPEENTMRIYMNTYTNVMEHVDIKNIPVKRWIHCVITLNNKYLDVYINGYLSQRKELDGMAKQNYGDLWLNLFGGFDGYMSNMRYYRRALKYYEVEKITKNGPSSEVCSDSGELPPYLNDNWWFNM